MKIFTTLMLLSLYLMNEARSSLDGQTNARVPLLNEDGTSSGTTISCSPFSVEYDTNDVEYVKYVLDTEEEGDSSVVWNLQPNKTDFEQCASYAAEQSAGMFYFDGETCETSESVYERKEKSCDSTAAKMVYMQKGLQPAVSSTCIEDGDSYNDGEEWRVSLPCYAMGRKRCDNGVIITEREASNSTVFVPHEEGVDYFYVDDNYCFVRPVPFTGLADTSNQSNVCSSVGARTCSIEIAGTDTTDFIKEIGDFLNSSVASSMTTSQLTVYAFSLTAESSDTFVNGSFFWGKHTQRPMNFPPSNNSLENCIVISADAPHEPSTSNCEEETTRDICCLLKD